MCRRGVRVKSQLKSHKRFAEAFLTYCQHVDNARLYSTNALEGPPKVHSTHTSPILLHYSFSDVNKMTEGRYRIYCFLAKIS